MTPTPHVAWKSVLPTGKALAFLMAGLGILLSALVYVILPAVGLSSLSESLNYQRMVMLCGAGIGAIGYWQYWRFIIPRPQLLVAFVLLGWPVVALGNLHLLELGVNIHFTPLLMLILMLPMLRIIFPHIGLLWRQVPWLKYYAAFIGWLGLYFLFYNANATDPRLSGGESAMGEGAVSLVQLIAYLYCLLCVALAAVTVLKIKNFRGFFDSLNQALLWVSALESLITIAGFPFQFTSMMLDGFLRAIGIFSHPNPFAHHMGILMVYLLGLYCYYQGERKHRMPTALLWSGLAINLIAFLLGLSKTAISAFALCVLIIFLLNLAVPAIRRSFTQITISLVTLLPLGLFIFEALSGKSFFGIMESRINETESMNWRSMVWQDLMADIDLATIWLGHGFTSANQTVFNLTFNDAQNANPLMMVHNAYIALLYDLGIMGYLMFLAPLSLMLQSARGWITAVKPALRTEHTIVIALTVYFLFACGFDEMSYMFDAPQLYWTLVSILFCMALREKQECRP